MFTSLKVHYHERRISYTLSNISYHICYDLSRNHYLNINETTKNQLSVEKHENGKLCDLFSIPNYLHVYKMFIFKKFKKILYSGNRLLNFNITNYVRQSS